MKRWSLDARSEGQPGYSLLEQEVSQDIRRLMLDRLRIRSLSRSEELGKTLNKCWMFK